MYRHKDIEVVTGRRKWTHEVYPLYNEYLYFKDATLRHFMPLGNILGPLAFITCHDKSSCIFEHCGPIKTRLENLDSGLLSVKMSTISGSMAMG